MGEIGRKLTLFANSYGISIQEDAREIMREAADALAQLRAERDELQSQLATFQDWYAKANQQRNEAEAREHNAHLAVKEERALATAAEAERDELRKALEPFAALPTKAHEGQRYSLELLVCPEGDAHPNEWGEKIRNAARLAARTREKEPGE